MYSYIKGKVVDIESNYIVEGKAIIPIAIEKIDDLKEKVDINNLFTNFMN